VLIMWQVWLCATKPIISRVKFPIFFAPLHAFELQEVGDRVAKCRPWNHLMTLLAVGFSRDYLPNDLHVIHI
jgi:hypothetical protein